MQKHFVKSMEVNESYLIDGIGTPFGFDLPRRNAAENAGKRRLGIYYILRFSAFAGTSIEAGGFANEDKEYFAIPGVAGSGLVAFPIDGNSMDPVIQDTDIVICKEISSLKEGKRE